ncbi:MAG TPA: CHASE2 domain-containing protein [Gammaproteobacteria bacterium]
MSLMTVTTRLLRPLLLPIATFSERLGNRFYILLALVMALVFSWAIVGERMAGMKYQAYDLIMKNRFHAPAADPNIVILDVDEASLAALAPELGRWPWTRSIWAETVEALARQQAAAIVFDITFSDLDLNNPAADLYFRDVAAAHPETYFTMIRLNPDNDAQSALKLATLAGVERIDAAANPNATVAMVVPYFHNILAGQRLGTNNLYPDDDGIVRRYHVYRDSHGYRIQALTTSVARALGAAVPAQPDITLNWRGKPGAYQSVPFHEFYTDMQRSTAQRPADEFRGKIVIIGSTAPSLFDIKPTPMAKIHPGVEVLATAMDNVRNGDYLREVPHWVQVVVTLALIAALTAAFVYNIDTRLLNTSFTATQTGFLATSYLVLNYTPLFIDLTAPFTAGLIFFSVARTYGQIAAMRRNGHPLFATTLDAGQQSLAIVMQCRFPASQHAVVRKQRHWLLRQAGLSRYCVAAPGMFKQAPLLNAIYQERLSLYWLVPAQHGAAAMADVTALLDKLTTRFGEHDSGVVVALHARQLTIDQRDGEWREAAASLLPEVITLAGTKGGNGVTLVASPEFWQCPAAPEERQIPETVRVRGFTREEAQS